jgi:hypothetical protein
MGPGPSYRCENVIETMRKDARRVDPAAKCKRIRSFRDCGTWDSMPHSLRIADVDCSEN